MSSAPSDFFCGDTVTIIATNKPLSDLTVAPSLNDYKWADQAIIRIYDPRNTMIIEDFLCPSFRVGWYSYRYKTVCECGIGIYRVEIVMSTAVVTLCTPGTTGTSGVDSAGTTGTTGTSGNPGGTEVCEGMQISYFRVMSNERF